MAKRSGNDIPKYITMINFKNWLQKEEEETPPAGDYGDTRNPVVAQDVVNKAVNKAALNPTIAKQIGTVAASNNNKDVQKSSFKAGAAIFNNPSTAKAINHAGAGVADVSAKIASNAASLGKSIKGMKKK